MSGSLTETGRRALELLLSDPQEMSKLTAAQVASKLGVHETTLIRLATQLGFSGYRQFRKVLAEEGLDPVTSTDRMMSRAPDAYTLAALVDDEVAAIQRLARVIGQSEVDELGQRLLDAHTVYLFGPPYAAGSLELMARRIRRLGIRAVVLPTSGRMIAENLSAFTEHDLVVSFVFRRPDPRLAAINAYAQSIGGATAVIVDEEGLRLDPSPDQVIVAPRGPRTVQRSVIAPSVLIYALQFSLFHLDRERMVLALRRLDDLARAIGDDEPSHWGA